MDRFVVVVIHIVLFAMLRCGQDASDNAENAQDRQRDQR